MTLAPQTRLGPYEVLGPLGAGGMGEVYRARDTRLGREVAIKVLPQHLSTNPEVRARFEREAKTVSSLNHPHICVLHDVGREGDIDFLVMELVEGDTLAARLEKGPLPIPEVLRLGAQIADALDKAHRAGVVHRDLKPGNVMLTRSGAKLMDFGLARAAGVGGLTSASGMSVAALTQSPTMVTPLTAEGTLVGTFQYMAPEQLEGKEADARTDLWSLGLVLYEMATARRAFEGKSQASLIAAILERDPPPITTLVPMAPPALERLIGACLAKDPEQRIQTAHDVKLQLQWIVEGGSQLGIAAPVASRRRARARLGWVIATAGVLALAALAVLGLRSREEVRVTRFNVMAPPNQVDASWPRVSPDGKLLAFLAVDSAGVPRIWVRPMDSYDAHPLPGTERAGRPFWSPDSRHLAFIIEGKLKRVSVNGGPAVLVCDVPGRVDGSWGSKDVVLLDAGFADTLFSVPAGGGVARGATTLDRSRGETGHAWPSFLPDGRHFLFQSLGGGSNGTAIKLGRLGTTESWELVQTESRAEFAPPNLLLYIKEGTLVAHVLDLGKHKLVGDPVPVADRLSTSRYDGDFSSSPAGVIAYAGGNSGIASELVWVDRAGRRVKQAASPNLFRDLALAPDGRRAAVGVENATSGKEDIWVYDLERGVASRLTFDPNDEIWPIWSPDGARILYASDRTGAYKIRGRLASGAGGEDSLEAVGTLSEGATDFSRDGRWIFSTILGNETNWDLWFRRAEAGAKPERFLTAPHVERDATLSPDGRWVAYRTNETGRNEIYVRSFPGGESKWQVSNAGGSDPVWRADGREMFYLAAEGAIMTVPIELSGEFRSGQPVELFRFVAAQGGFLERRWAVTGDGQRFLINTPMGQAQRPEFAIAINWTKELRRK